MLKHVQHFLADARDRAGAKKRGGGRSILSLEGLPDRQREQIEPAAGLSPDQAFDLHWANALLERALNRLGEEFAAQGKADLFEQLKDCPVGRLPDRLGRRPGT
jgi:hypothetical protein